MAFSHGDGLAVDVLDAGQLHPEGSGTQPQGHGNGHGGQHVVSVQFPGDGRIPHGSPAGHFHYGGVESVLFIETQGLRHDDGGGTGDRNKAHLNVGFLQIAGFYGGAAGSIFCGGGAAAGAAGQGDESSPDGHVA